MKNPIRAAGCLLLVVCTAQVWAGEDESPWMVDGELAAGYDSNLTRAGYKRDVVEDEQLVGSIAAAWNHEFGMMSAITLRGFLEGEAYDEVDTLNRTSAGVQGIYRWQHTLGFAAPFFQVSVAGQVDDVASGLRDSNRYTVQGFMTKRLTDALRYSVGAEGSYQEADGRVFDIAQGRLFVNGDLALTPNWAMYGTWSLISGDTVSSAQLLFCNGAAAGDIYGLIDAAEEVEVDPALNKALCGTWLSYRIPATSHAFVLGFNRGFGHNMSFDISAQHVIVNADGNNEYQRTLVRAGVLARF